jgi:hypothetical protein
MKSSLRMCLDRVVALPHKVAAAALAVEQNAANAPKLPPLLPGVSMNPTKISPFTGKRWPKGKILGVTFLDGSATHNIVQKDSASQLNGASFDAKPIMLYPFPGRLIVAPVALHAQGTRANTDLSAGDRWFVKAFYGSP